MFWGKFYQKSLWILLIGSSVSFAQKLSSEERKRLIQCTWALKQLSHIDEDVYRFRLKEIEPDIYSASASAIDPLELMATKHFKKFVSIPIVLAPDIGKHKSTPGFDGILYDHYGVAYANLSIKNVDVSKLTHGNVTQTVRSSRSSARSQLAKVYDLPNFLNRSGFWNDNNGHIWPQKGMPHQIVSAARMQYFINIFGLSLNNPRKTSVLVNIFNSDTRPRAFVPIFELRHTSHGKWRRQKNDTYLYIQNVNGTSNDFGANLTHLSENLKNDPKISEYIFMTPTQILVIRPEQVILKEINP